MFPAGDGGSQSGDAFAEFGLNADGTPKAKPEGDGKPGDGIKTPDPEIVALKGSLAKAEAQLEKMSGLAGKVAIVDKLVAALTGSQEVDPNAAQYKKIFGEFKDVIRVSSPGMYKVLQLAESDPDFLDKIRQGQDALAGTHLNTLNSSAHNAVMSAAKPHFKSATVQELQEIVLPYEKTITDIINANRELRARFVGGDHTVATEIFDRLMKPHAAIRLRQKQTQMQKSGLPSAPPRGAAGTPPGNEGGSGAGDKKKYDLRTPQGRTQFHKDRIGAYLDKKNAASEE